MHAKTNTLMCTTECMARKRKNACNRALRRLRLQKQFVWAQVQKIPIIGPNYYSQYSLKIQIIPLNDIENGITRLQSCSAPVLEKSHWCCYKIWWQHPCSQKETMCAKCSDTKLHEGKLRSQPWLVSWDHTVSLCYYTIVSAVSYRLTSLYSVSISYLY